MKLALNKLRGALQVAFIWHEKRSRRVVYTTFLGLEGFIEIDMETGMEGMVDKLTTRPSYRDNKFMRPKTDEVLWGLFSKRFRDLYMSVGNLDGIGGLYNRLKETPKRPHWLTPFNLPIITRCAVDIIPEHFTGCP
ncbi:hypothetical protein BBBOND_0309430 [Babesia bigemina]|uniref:Uncharacterized protein n=1 Tax=Babesia bigemina TaxID=5866 RepID=A0A061DEC5_BABBI|nr:hypothetical protein BBBOND_0309430 [Babesia bigemina]CDR97040.1 hypothetical protein BBBOND_0309430 [Babesia bigemina]|eukprot:XP_012769226.1 hypothetical protein BBBOND_0309430 [Babesia bigemina]